MHLRTPAERRGLPARRTGEEVVCLIVVEDRPDMRGHSLPEVRLVPVPDQLERPLLSQVGAKTVKSTWLFAAKMGLFPADNLTGITVKPTEEQAARQSGAGGSPPSSGDEAPSPCEEKGTQEVSLFPCLSLSWAGSVLLSGTPSVSASATSVARRPLPPPTLRRPCPRLHIRTRRRGCGRYRRLWRPVLSVAS